MAWYSTACTHLGWTLALSCRVREGLDYVERAVTIHERLGMKVYLSMFYVRWAEALLLGGHIDRAKDTAERALDLAAQSGERGIEATAYHLLGAAFATGAADDIERTLRHYESARALGAELGMRPLVAHCHLGLGKLYRRTSRREQAQEHITTATTMYREMDMRFWLEQAEAEMRELA
jgi:sugar phosphate isomerase/epimerase